MTTGRDISPVAMFEESVSGAIETSISLFDAMLAMAGDRAFGLVAASMSDRLVAWMAWSLDPTGMGWEAKIQEAMALTGWNRYEAENHAWAVDTLYRKALAERGDWDGSEADFGEALMRGRDYLEHERMEEAGIAAARNLQQLARLREMPAAVVGPDPAPLDVAAAFSRIPDAPTPEEAAALGAGVLEPAVEEGALRGPPPNARDLQYGAFREEQEAGLV